MSIIILETVIGMMVICLFFYVMLYAEWKISERIRDGKGLKIRLWKKHDIKNT